MAAAADVVKTNPITPFENILYTQWCRELFTAWPQSARDLCKNMRRD